MARSIRMVDERAFLGLCAEGFRLAGGKRDAAVGDRAPPASVHRALDGGGSMTQRELDHDGVLEMKTPAPAR